MSIFRLVEQVVMATAMRSKRESSDLATGLLAGDARWRGSLHPSSPCNRFQLYRRNRLQKSPVFAVVPAFWRGLLIAVKGFIANSGVASIVRYLFVTHRIGPDRRSPIASKQGATASGLPDT